MTGRDPVKKRAGWRRRYERIRADPELWATYCAARKKREDRRPLRKRPPREHLRSASGRAKHAEARRRRLAKMKLRRDLQPAEASVNLLKRLYALAPAYLTLDERSELVAEAALLIYDKGMSEAEAMKAGRKALTPYQLRNAKPIDDCFWI